MYYEGTNRPYCKYRNRDKKNFSRSRDRQSFFTLSVNNRNQNEE